MFLLVLITIGSTGWSAVNWPFELFLSYIRHVLILAPLVAAMAWFAWRNSFPVLLIAVALVVFPFATFDKYRKPTHANCQSESCLKIVSLNLRKRSDAIEKFAATDAVQTADIIGLYDIPLNYTQARLERLFPDYDYVHLMSRSPRDDAYIGSFIAILSKRSPSAEIYEGISDAHNTFAPRGYIVLPVAIDGKTIHITALHTRLPLSHASARQRDIFLGQIVQRNEGQENYIYMGDYNLTPWTPEFKKLSGKRAGDPRLISTWDAQRFWTGIPIDHIMVSENVEVIESRILNGVGSDHFPIMAVIRVH